MCFRKVRVSRMKKLYIILCILLSLCICGCSGSEESYLAELGGEREDVNSYYDKLYDKIVTEKGVYRIADDGIHYIEWNSGKDIPLCNRPDCRHDSEECNAYLPMAAKIYSYGNYIYAIAYSMDMQGISLYRMSFDGSEKIELNKMLYFDENDSDISTLTYQFIIYKGYGYFVCNHTYEDLKTESDTTLYKIKLTKDSEMEEVFTVSGYDNAIFFSGTDDNGIYVYHTHIDVSKKPYERMCDNYYINTDTEKSERIAGLDNRGLYRVHGRKGYYIDDTKYMMFDLEEKTSEEIVDCGTDMEVFFDNKYMYIDTHIGCSTRNTPLSERVMYVYDYEGVHVKTIDGLKDTAVVAIKGNDMLILDVDEDTGEESFSKRAIDG